MDTTPTLAPPAAAAPSAAAPARTCKSRNSDALSFDVADSTCRDPRPHPHDKDNDDDNDNDNDNDLNLNLNSLLDLDPTTVDRLMLKSAYAALQQAYASAQSEHICLDTLLVDAQQETRLLTLQVRALVDLILEKKPAFRRSNPSQRHQTTVPPPPPTPSNGTSSSGPTLLAPPVSHNSSALVQ